MSKKFNHLNIPSHWQSYWTRFPEGHTILEALIQWVSQVDEMVDNQNKLSDTVTSYGSRLDQFIDQFDGHLSDEVKDTLGEWQQTGFLDVVINDALDTKYHEMDDRLTSQLAQIATQVASNGNDDTLNIQNALNHSEKNVVFLTDDEYFISDSLLVHSFNVLTAKKGTKVTLKNNSNCHLVKTVGGSTVTTNVLISNILFDGNKGNQSEAFSVLYLDNLEYSTILDVEAKGGLRTGVFPDVSRHGEGLELVNSKFNQIVGGSYSENAYDGIKFRGSSFNTVTNTLMENNGRSGIQLAYITGVENTPSRYNVINGIRVLHDTGISSPVAPNTSGLYVHTGEYNTFNNYMIYGVAQGIGLIEGANDNTFTGGIIRTRHEDSWVNGVIDISPHNTVSVRNVFSNNKIRALSGVDGTFLRVANGSHGNSFNDNMFSGGDNGGDWNLQILGNNTRLNDNSFPLNTYLLNENDTILMFNNINLSNKHSLSLTSNWSGNLELSSSNDLYHLEGRITVGDLQAGNPIANIGVINNNTYFTFYHVETSSILGGFYITSSNGNIYLRGPALEQVNTGDELVINALLAK